MPRVSARGFFFKIFLFLFGIVQKVVRFAHIKTKKMKNTTIYYHVIEDSGYDNVASRGYYATLEEAQKEVNRLQSYFEDCFFYVFQSTSKKEPEFTTC